MEVDQATWLNQARENIGKYLDIGGEGKGDEPHRLQGTELLNTIGFAMGLEMQDPRKWTAAELQKARRNDLVFFRGDARKVIDVIANQIFKACECDNVYLTIIPIELYHERRLYELPLFRVSCLQNSRRYYVDNIGRIYQGYDDWYSNSKLPPCEMAFPYGLKLQYESNCKEPKIFWADTPSARPLSKVVSATSTVASVGGAMSGIGLFFFTGGASWLICLGISVCSAAWGVGRAAHQLYDKSSHGGSINPFTDAESRKLWLGIAAPILSFGTMGATMRLTYLAERGRNTSTMLEYFVKIAKPTSVAINVTRLVDDGVQCIRHRNDPPTTAVPMYAAARATQTREAHNYQTAGAIIGEMQNMVLQ